MNTLTAALALTTAKHLPLNDLLRTAAAVLVVAASLIASAFAFARAGRTRPWLTTGMCLVAISAEALLLATLLITFLAA